VKDLIILLPCKKEMSQVSVKRAPGAGRHEQKADTAQKVSISFLDTPFFCSATPVYP
jgi:hypothetical protein